jgi:FG-GAP-like repeat
MNKGDGTGTYNPFVQPPTPVGARASPSETTDFNGDGIVDIVVANLNADTLSILFGNANGTFTPSQTPQVGGQPRGVVVIDVDGDGDIDIVNTNADGDNLSLLLNDGTGKFPTTAAPDGGPSGIMFWDSAFGGGRVASQEFGLFAGDMNEDGILDLVIGARGIGGNNAGVVVNVGTGKGGFAFGSLQGPQTSGWQVAVGDLNGDGHEDVATADADLSTTLSKNTVTILLGDGTGKVTPTQTFSQNLNRPFAIDIGDIDGDKDLDVVVSNFSGNWEILLNDGTSKVTASKNFPPAKSASCALLIDVDNDQDLDLVVVDEEQDEVIILRQSP